MAKLPKVKLTASLTYLKKFERTLELIDKIAKSRAMDLQTLRESNIRRDREWDPDNKITLSFRGTELAGETGEACNIIKKMERVRLGIANDYPIQSKKKALAEELADIIICVDLIGMDLGIDLSSAVRDKFNKSSEKMKLKTRIK